MRTFIENYLHFMKNCIRPHYEKLKPLKSGFIENSNFENNRDPWPKGNILVLAAVVLHEGGGDIDMEVGPLVLAGLLEHSPGSLVQNFNTIRWLCIIHMSFSYAPWSPQHACRTSYIGHRPELDRSIPPPESRCRSCAPWYEEIEFTAHQWRLHLLKLHVLLLEVRVGEI